MIEGQAHDLGWKIRVYCRWGKREGLKAIRACNASVEVDVPTLLWTRGREFPLALLDARMKCPRCGSRRVVVAFEPPAPPVAVPRRA